MTKKIEFMDRHPSVRKLIGLAGGIKPLADKLGVTPSSISGWVQVPIRRVFEIEDAFPGQITRYEMRSDCFGDAP